MKVLWTAAAISQLQAIHDYYAHIAPDYAKRIVDRITRRSKQIVSFPYSGQMVPEYELSEVRQIIEGRYRIIYLIKEDRIEVLAVIHTSRDGLKPLN
ncbi:MAG: type II toxin-antitoxin system RelE/ParE family toxin [Acidobacteria bacterium]|nr:type II toxin-antitoxin system RelE/ParE family toxin [Acidobacteriota bacterium]